MPRGRARGRRGDEAARVAAGDAEDAHDEAAALDDDDFDLHRLVRARRAGASRSAASPVGAGCSAILWSLGSTCDDDDVDLVADLHDLFGLLDALDREIGRVDEAVDAGLELDERAERLEARDLALVLRALRVLLRDLLPGIGDRALRESQILPLSSMLRILTCVVSPALKTSLGPSPRLWLISLSGTSPSTPPTSTNAPNGTTLRTVPSISSPTLRRLSASSRVSFASSSSIARRESTTSRPRLAYWVTTNGRRLPTRCERSAPGRRSTCEAGANARRPSTSTSMPPLMTPVTSPSMSGLLVEGLRRRRASRFGRACGWCVRTTRPPRAAVVVDDGRRSRRPPRG